MDIQEIKNFAKNKIEADDLTKQVRQRIKETAWEKQNRREGFTETFKPLISQFEKPEDSKENIFTQNQKMLRNQLALTSGLKDNQKAITDGFSQFKRLVDAQDRLSQLDRLADMQELPVNVWEESPKTGELKQFEEDKPKGEYFDLYQRFKDKDKEEIEKILNENLLLQLGDLLLTNNINLKSNFNDANEKIRSLNGTIAGKSRKENKSKEDEDFIITKRYEQDILIEYKDTIGDILKAREKYQTGQGIFFYNSPQELIKRFELLAGSLAAGNNGVLPEYIQIAHRLRDLGIVTNSQLNKLLRNYINIR